MLYHTWAAHSYTMRFLQYKVGEGHIDLTNPFQIEERNLVRSRSFSTEEVPSKLMRALSPPDLQRKSPLLSVKPDGVGGGGIGVKLVVGGRRKRRGRFGETEGKLLY